MHHHDLGEAQRPLAVSRPAASAPPELSIETVTTLDRTVEALRVITEVWGPDGARDIDLYFVIVGHGGYLSIAHRDGVAIGASFGFLSDGGQGLHSHMTGVIPGQLGRGVGHALKQHQRAWCGERGIDHITWTFDPLIRRNAWFNLIRLGATIERYHVNHYGALTDDVNAGDETDRVEARWNVRDAAPGSPIVPSGNELVVATPADIESLRRADMTAALTWRQTMRNHLHLALVGGARIIGMTSDGSYVVAPPGALIDHAS
jgi:predicted GNAT superfamily acetyltransferase